MPVEAPETFAYGRAPAQLVEEVFEEDHAILRLPRATSWLESRRQSPDAVSYPIRLWPRPLKDGGSLVGIDLPELRQCASINRVSVHHWHLAGGRDSVRSHVPNCGRETGPLTRQSRQPSHHTCSQLHPVARRKAAQLFIVHNGKGLEPSGAQPRLSTVFALRLLSGPISAFAWASDASRG
jgi:hypothetical protein